MSTLSNAVEQALGWVATKMGLLDIFAALDAQRWSSLTVDATLQEEYSSGGTVQPVFQIRGGIEEFSQDETDDCRIGTINGDKDL